MRSGTSWTVGLLALLGGCVSTPPLESLPQVQAWIAAGGPPPPPVETCPHVAQVDLWDIARAQGALESLRERTPAEARQPTVFDEIAIPEHFRRPPADALVVLQAVEPPGGMYPNTVWSVVWKEQDGTWWFWRQNRDPTYWPSPPAPLPPGASAEAIAAYRAQFTDGAWSPPDHERWPPAHGRLATQQVTAIEAALADPCRAWEPDGWPSRPRLRGQSRPGAELPLQDSTPIHIQIQEMGRPPRAIWPPRDHPSHAAVFRWVAYGPQRAPESSEPSAGFR